MRVVIREKGLEDRIEIIAARTRVADSPYYRINPSGRVPYLVREDGVGLEDSTVICAYLDRLDGDPRFEWPAGEESWEARRLDALARGMMDGIAVWLREIRRPENERSPTIIRHEADRSVRLADFWEKEVGHRLMGGGLNIAQITLGCALGLEARLPDFRWRAGHPKLCEWYDRLVTRRSFIETLPRAWTS